jgi:hypothetical protein
VLLAGCTTSAGYIYATYQYEPERRVRIDCGGDYAVYDKAADSRMLVVTNAYLEARNVSCGPNEPAILRARRVAETYLAASNRPECRVTDSSELTPLHYEVTYACPAVAPAAGRRS